MAEHGFKAKSIRQILHNKLGDWLKTIEDNDLRLLLQRDTIVTGGSITSMLMGDEIKDFDLYFKTLETTKAVAEYYCKKFTENNPENKRIPLVKVDKEGRVTIFVKGVGALESDDAEDTEEFAAENNLGEGRADDIEKMLLGSDKLQADGTKRPKYRPVFLSSNAITLSNKVQLVIRFYGTPEEIHKNYDFEHCKNVYDYATDSLHLNPKALEAILSKTLTYTGSLYPICSLFRMRKFIERGWRISAGEILKMAWQVNALNLKDVNVIKEQLTGCDQAYMRWLITDMEAYLEKNPNAEIDSNYIVDLVDKVFNQ